MSSETSSLYTPPQDIVDALEQAEEHYASDLMRFADRDSIINVRAAAVSAVLTAIYKKPTRRGIFGIQCDTRHPIVPVKTERSAQGYFAGDAGRHGGMWRNRISYNEYQETCSSKSLLYCGKDGAVCA